MIRFLKTTADSACDTAVAAGQNRPQPPSPPYPPLILICRTVWVLEQEMATRFVHLLAASNLRGWRQGRQDCGVSWVGWRTAQHVAAVFWVV